jgi:hypothetical protein
MAEYNETGISPTDVDDMRRIFDEARIDRSRHCFRWSESNARWELSEAAPADRTMKAFFKDATGQWTKV